jgi:hypothetical protein
MLHTIMLSRGVEKKVNTSFTSTVHLHDKILLSCDSEDIYDLCLPVVLLLFTCMWSE